MPRRSTKTKKHLDFNALRQGLSKHLERIDDPRVQGRCTHSVHDTFMTAFACMFFQDPSLAHFQRRLEDVEGRSNVMTLFDVSSTPKDSQLRAVIDDIDSEVLRPVFKTYIERLRRGKHLDPFQVVPGKYLCAMDGVHYHGSDALHCEHCLSKTHKDGTTTYHHASLQGAFVHPDQRQVIPTMPEPIANTDGVQKQDCEINAAKRFLSKLKRDHPRMGIIITGDGLFSKAPMIEHTLAQGFDYLFVAKPKDHVYMMDWLAAYDALPERIVTDAQGRKHRYTYQNHVPLHGQEDATRVNVLRYELINTQGKVTYKNSWVTNLAITPDNVAKLAKAGRSRWRIENECFNTLKNQGYHLEHNFGHGKQHLSHNLYVLTLLAFFYHQIFELTDPAYQVCRKAMVSKRMLWETFRVLIRYFILDSWSDLMYKLMSGRGGIPCLENDA